MSNIDNAFHSIAPYCKIATQNNKKLVSMHWHFLSLLLFSSMTYRFFRINGDISKNRLKLLTKYKDDSEKEEVVRRCSSKFHKIHGKKHLCQSLFLNKVAGIRPATLFKKRLWHRCFPVNFETF